MPSTIQIQKPNYTNSFDQIQSLPLVSIYHQPKYSKTHQQSNISPQKNYVPTKIHRNTNTFNLIPVNKINKQPNRYNRSNDQSHTDSSPSVSQRNQPVCNQAYPTRKLPTNIRSAHRQRLVLFNPNLCNCDLSNTKYAFPSSYSVIDQRKIYASNIIRKNNSMNDMLNRKNKRDSDKSDESKSNIGVSSDEEDKSNIRKLFLKLLSLETSSK